MNNENNIEIQHIIELIIYPKNMDSLKNLKSNIKVYGYLEFLSGLLNGATKIKGFEILYNDIKDSIFNRNLNDLKHIYDKFMKDFKSELEKKTLNTFVIVIIHKINKELGIYGL